MSEVRPQSADLWGGLQLVDHRRSVGRGRSYWRRGLPGDAKLNLRGTDEDERRDIDLRDGTIVPSDSLGTMVPSYDGLTQDAINRLS